MTTAIRCDRCAKFDDRWQRLTIRGKELLANVVRPQYYPESADLCGQCAEELRTMLTRWFEDAKETT